MELLVRDVFCIMTLSSEKIMTIYMPTNSAYFYYMFLEIRGKVMSITTLFTFQKKFFCL